MRSRIGKNYVPLHLCLIGATLLGCASEHEGNDSGQGGVGQGGNAGSLTGVGGTEQQGMGGVPSGGGSGAAMGVGGSAQNASARIQFVLREVR